MLRRSFFSRVAAASYGFGLAPSQSPGTIPPRPAWQPVRHEQDDWLDTLPGKHRVAFDTWMAPNFGNAHFVPAGVVAATRAQERGYSIISIG